MLERLLERGERVVAFLGQEGDGERDFCSEILEMCDRASIPARSGRKLGEETVRWLDDRIRPELAIAVGMSGEVPLAVGGNCRLGLVELIDRFQVETCPGVVLRQRGQDMAVREIEAPTQDDEREDVYLEIVDQLLSVLDEYLDRLGASHGGGGDSVRFGPIGIDHDELATIVASPEPGPAVAALEEEVARYVGADHVFAVRSMEDAFAALFRAIGIGEGDEVICPAIMSGTLAAAVRGVGAVPTLVDVEPHRLTLDPGRVAEAAGPRTRALVISHALGQPARLDGLYGIAAELGIEVLEDGGASLGARFGDSRLGRAPCSTVFGFPARPEGGEPGLALVTLSPDLASRAGSELESLRIGDGLASIAQRTFDRWEDVISTRREIAGAYASELVRYDAFRVPPTPEDALSTYPLFLLRLTRFARTSAEDLYKLLRESGVEVRGLAVPVTERDLGRLPVTEEARSHGLLLPIRPDLTTQERQRILDSIFDFAIG
jgi:dTDP-4-amino-4,6-dideoxygalactose transaminase